MKSNLKQCLLKPPNKILSTILCLVALHSFSIGLILITQPAFLMKLAGFGQTCERFFAAQGGVFHILIGVAYLMEAVNSEKYHYLIVFSIIVKAVATLFLMVYCFAVDFKWIILLSGIVDFVMGLSIFIALQNYLHYQECISSRSIYE